MKEIKPSASAGLASPAPSAPGRLYWLGWICAIGVAGVFLYAGTEKIIHPRDFINQIRFYRILPESLVTPFGLLLPWWEVGAALAILWPRTRLAGAVLIGGMCVMFMVAVSYAAFYLGVSIDCGCFGKSNSATAGWKTIGIDVVCLTAAILSVVLTRSRPVSSSYTV